MKFCLHKRKHKIVAQEPQRKRKRPNSRVIMNRVMPPRDRPGGGLAKKGTDSRRIILQGVDADGREFYFHATKGWRSYRPRAA